MLDFYINMFHQKGADILPGLCRLSIPRQVFLAKYKSMPQLEELEETEKGYLKKLVNDLFKGETPQFRLEACKIIFTLNNCL